jgi:predicted lipoprotein with Yx(FWY)xxD motif
MRSPSGGDDGSSPGSHTESGAALVHLAMGSASAGLVNLPRTPSRVSGMTATPSRVAAATALVLCAVATQSGCGKSITIGDSAPATASATPVATPSSTPPPAAQNNTLQVVDSTAAENGKTGNGGTVVGVQVQEAPPRWVQLSAVTSPPLNAKHLININQAALYRFDKDSARPSRSRCDDSCAVRWPPVTIQEGGNVYLAGVDPKEVGAIRRADGDIQLTIGGWPIYRFARDSAPGDLNGQGVDGTWFAVGPRGEKVRGNG